MIVVILESCLLAVDIMHKSRSDVHRDRVLCGIAMIKIDPNALKHGTVHPYAVLVIIKSFSPQTP